MARLCLAVGLVLLLVPAASAQGTEGLQKGQFELSFSGGISLPMGDFGDAANMGFLAGANGGFYVTPQVVIGAEFNYHMYPGSDEIVAAFQVLTGDASADFDWAEVQVTGYGKYLFMPKNVSPYIKGQAGIYSLRGKGSALGTSATASQSDMGIAASGGVQFKGEGKIGGFAEVTLHNVFTEGSSTTFVDARGGVTFFFGGP